MKWIIRIGNQTSFAARPPWVPFEFAVKSKFSAFEFFPDKHADGMGWTPDDIPHDRRREIKETAANNDIDLSVHASLQSTPATPEGQYALDRDIEFAREIDAKLLVIHLPRTETLDLFLENLPPFVAQLKDREIEISFENTPITKPEFVNLFFERLDDQFGTDPCMGLCFDIGHANLCPTTLNDYVEFCGQLDHFVRINHLHGHENFGDRDSHLTLFTGPCAMNPKGITILLDMLLNARNFRGNLILEQWPWPPSLLLTARDRLYEIMDEVLVVE